MQTHFAVLAYRDLAEIATLEQHETLVCFRATHLASVNGCSGSTTVVRRGPLENRQAGYLARASSRLSALWDWSRDQVPP